MHRLVSFKFLNVLAIFIIMLAVSVAGACKISSSSVLALFRIMYVLIPNEVFHALQTLQ